MIKETIIISLGGSLVAPGEIDVNFLKNFKHTLSKYLPARNTSHSDAGGKQKYQFFILVGGGKIARHYQKALLEFGAKSHDRDWIGIDVTILNAKVLQQVFAGDCYPEIIIDPNKKIKTAKNVIIGAGWKPGWSTDYDSVLIAQNHNIKTIINLSNIDYVYDRDPKEFSDAKPLKEIDWKSFSRIVGDKWSPGTSAPFDPVATKLASRLKLKVVMLNGHNLSNFENFLNNKPFIGTVIE